MFTLLTLLTLAVGIGANTSIFTVVYSVLLKPLPLEDPDRLVAVWQTAPGLGIPDLNASPSSYFTYREESRTFEDIALWRNESATVTGTAEPERVDVLRVTDGMLGVLRVRPLAGRGFTREDDAPGRPLTVLLTHGYWQRKFGGDPGMVGRRILIDNEAREVIGILPAGFQFMDSRAALVMPFQLNRATAFVGQFSYQAVARLKPGVTVAQANADVGRMIPMMQDKFPLAPGLNSKMLEEARMGPNVRLLKNDVVGDVGNVLWVLLGTIGIVLCIACANVANLMLVRVEGRWREMGMRAALGAGRGRLAGELLVESGMLGLGGGVLGIGFAAGAIGLLRELAPRYLPRLEEIQIDGVAVAYTLGLSVVAGIGFGLMPVWKLWRAELDTALRGGGRTASEGRERHRARNTLVVVQVALALVLLVAAGLMVRTMGALRNVDPGFREPAKLATYRLSIPQALVAEPERVTRTYEEIGRKLAAIPGVEAAGMASSVTMDGNRGNDPLFAEGKEYREGQLPPLRRWKYVTPGYFGAMGNPLKAGRDLTWVEVHERRPVVLVSENLARELWGSAEAAIGKRVRENPRGVWREVIGVAGDERDNGVDQAAPTIVHLPMAASDLWRFPVQVQRSMRVVLRTPRAGSEGLMNEVRQAVWGVNPQIPIANPRTMAEIYAGSMARTTFALVLLSMAAGMALLLGVVGIYGVISYSVSQRTREIGIRMALGAEARAVQAMFVRHGLTLAGIGLVIGLGAALGLSRLMGSLLYGVSAGDPATYAAVGAVLAGAAATAAYLPARRAARVEPLEALRAE